MSVLVTGGAGFIGSILVEGLLYEGYDVTVLDNFRYEQSSLAHLCQYEQLEIVNGDTRDDRILRDLVPKHDLIIPLAALVGSPLCDKDPTAATTTNLGAVVRICELMAKDQLLIVPTTNSGYGIGPNGEKGKSAFCTEETPLNPLSLYGRDKADLEREVLGRENSVCLRLATVFGMSPRMRIDLLVNDFVHRAVTDKFVVLFESRFMRNHIHVRDVARAFIHTIDHFEKMKGQPFNVGLSDTNISKMELCQRIKNHLPEFFFLEWPYAKDPDQRDYVVSNAKIEATGYKTKYSLDDGIKELIKGYQMLRNRVYGNV